MKGKGCLLVRRQLQEHLEKRVNQCVTNNRDIVTICEKIDRKKDSLLKREGEIVKAKAIGHIQNKVTENEVDKVFYRVHFQYLINHKENLYVEEEIEERVAEFYKKGLVNDKELNPYAYQDNSPVPPISEMEDRNGKAVKAFFKYDRLQAVKYAERWWNDYNPAFKSFDVDCTNYISQCLYAGNAPMRGYPNRSNGWWMQSQNWSYSWTVANSLRLYLPGSKIGLRGQEVSKPSELQLGDVICYDFQGDGRFDHTTIVTAKDADGMPLVNAHTTNSRMRYWAYEDSSAYTPNIKYKFIHIMDY